MVVCGQCGGNLRRVHRTFFERFKYLAVYECRECDAEIPVPRPFTYHLGPHCRCPRCGTFHLVRHKQRDRIDGMHYGVFNLVEKLAGGKLTHCRICRLQFYDRRALASEAAAAEKHGAGPAKN
jgi:DNA-directed RNA polymerase subunit RPC12/RpoP